MTPEEERRLDRQIDLLGLVERARQGELRVKSWPRFDVSFPWGPSDTPWWKKWRWFWARRGSPRWPCTQVIVGVLYVRVWWPNVVRFYHRRMGLVGAYWLEEFR